MLLGVAKGLLTKLLTEQFLKQVVIELLSWFAAKSDNKLDDKLVAAARDALDA
jgi:hypothetical protein